MSFSVLRAPTARQPSIILNIKVMKAATVFLCMLWGWGPSGFAQQPAPSGMVLIPEGTIAPFLQTTERSAPVRVPAFYLDEHAVTNGEFLAFVKANPSWARSRVSRMLADEGYLAHWAGDFVLGSAALTQSPVTNVSWFAAEAYAAWKGKRLPTLREWEYAAAAPPVDLPRGMSLSTFILEWYGRPTPPRLPAVETTFRNRFGVYDLHGLIWEWTEDFNSVITGGDSRSGKADDNFVCGAASLKAANKEDYAAFMRYAFRESLKGSYTTRNLGFRCAGNLAP